MANFLLAHEAIGWWPECAKWRPFPLIYDACMFLYFYIPELCILYSCISVFLYFCILVFSVFFFCVFLIFGRSSIWQSVSNEDNFLWFMMFVFSAKDAIYQSTRIKTFDWSMIELSSTFGQNLQFWFNSLFRPNNDL